MEEKGKGEERRKGRENVTEDIEERKEKGDRERE